MTGLRAGAALPSGDFESVAVGEHPSRQRSRILGASNGRIDSKVPQCGARQSQILRKLTSQWRPTRHRPIGVVDGPASGSASEGSPRSQLLLRPSPACPGPRTLQAEYRRI